jgi:flagellar hook protein FlgE
MVSPINSNISALAAFGKKMAVSSNNIANLESEGFKKSRAVLLEGEQGGVIVDIERLDTPGDVRVEYREDGVTERELSNVDLAQEITDTLSTQRGYEANLKAVKVQDELIGTILDIFG